MMKQSALIVASITIFLLSGGLLHPAPTNSPGGAPGATMSSSRPTSSMEVIPQERGFDLESCETNCRSYYGIAPYIEEQGAGGGGATDSNARYLIIAHCIEQCQKRFWKEFDKSMKNLDRSSPR